MLGKLNTDKADESGGNYTTELHSIQLKYKTLVTKIITNLALSVYLPTAQLHT